MLGLEGGLGLVEMMVVAGASGVEAGDVVDSACPHGVGGHGLADGLFVEAFGEYEVDDGLLAAVGTFAVTFLEEVGELNDGFSPPSVAFSPGVRGDRFPSEAVEEGGVHEMVECADAVPSARGFSEEADGKDEEVTEEGHGYDHGHEQKSCGTFFEGAEHWRRWTWVGRSGRVSGCVLRILVTHVFFWRRWG